MHGKILKRTEFTFYYVFQCNLYCVTAVRFVRRNKSDCLDSGFIAFAQLAEEKVQDTLNLEYEGCCPSSLHSVNFHLILCLILEMFPWIGKNRFGQLRWKKNLMKLVSGFTQNNKTPCNSEFRRSQKLCNFIFREN